MKNPRRASPTDPPTLTTTDAARDWTLDALGNWKDFDVDADGNGTYGAGDLQQERSHNNVNEIGTIGVETSGQGDNWYDPTFDDAGNMRTGPMPGMEKDADAAGRKHQYTFDAWNRLVEVEV